MTFRHAPSVSPSPASYWDSAPSPQAACAPMHVTVVGAGIIGLTSAAALVRAGHTVTVVDAAPAAAQGASFGNGCQLSYGYVAPLAQPGLLTQLPGLLLKPDAPLQIRPRLDLAQWRWMLDFLCACRPQAALRATAALLALGQESREETERWIAGADARQLSFGRHGKLVLLDTPQARAAAVRQMQAQAGMGPPQRLVNEDECLRLEPALAAFRGKLAGAIYTESECVVDSLALCHDLELQLRVRGVQFDYGVRVTGFARQGGRVTRLLTEAGPRPVEALVLANGAGSAPLARKLGLRLPVYPLKGYSITVAVSQPQGAPTISITDAARKLVYARIGDRLRVAGIAELRGDDPRIDPRRIAQLAGCMARAFGAAIDLETAEAWVGQRPATPTSVPLITRAAGLSNVFFNVGQGALGLTLAFGSARRLAAQVSGTA